MIRAANVLVCQSYRLLFTHYQGMIDRVPSAGKIRALPRATGVRKSWDVTPVSKSYFTFLCFPFSLIWYEFVLNQLLSVFRIHFFSISGNANLYLENIIHLTRKATGGGFRKEGNRKRFVLLLILFINSLLNKLLYFVLSLLSFSGSLVAYLLPKLFKMCFCTVEFMA